MERKCKKSTCFTWKAINHKIEISKNETLNSLSRRLNPWTLAFWNQVKKMKDVYTVSVNGCRPVFWGGSLCSCLTVTIFSSHVNHEYWICMTAAWVAARCFILHHLFIVYITIQQAWVQRSQFVAFLSNLVATTVIHF